MSGNLILHALLIFHEQLATKSMSSTTETELESRVRELTESLIQKQTMVEALSTEKNSLGLQLERLGVIYNVHFTGILRQIHCLLQMRNTSVQKHKYVYNFLHGLLVIVHTQHWKICTITFLSVHQSNRYVYMSLSWYRTNTKVFSLCHRVVNPVRIWLTRMPHVKKKAKYCIVCLAVNNSKWWTLHVRLQYHQNIIMCTALLKADVWC